MFIIVINLSNINFLCTQKKKIPNAFKLSLNLWYQLSKFIKELIMATCVCEMMNNN